MFDSANQIGKEHGGSLEDADTVDRLLCIAVVGGNLRAELAYPRRNFLFGKGYAFNIVAHHVAIVSFTHLISTISPVSSVSGARMLRLPPTIHRISLPPATAISGIRFLCSCGTRSSMRIFLSFF